MTPKEQGFEIALSDIGDALRVRFVRDGGLIIRFTVQFEALIDGRYVPIVRYDTAHGFAHRDMLDWDGSTRHWERMANADDYRLAMTEAIRDLRANWERYRSEFIRRRR